MSTASPNPLQHWSEEGCLCLENAITSDELKRLQIAFEHCAAKAKDAWLQGVAQGTAPAAYFDIPDPMAQDPLFVDLVDHPAYYPLVQKLTGDQTLFLFAQFRTVPPSPLSYVGWHFDVPHSNPLHLKVQIYLNDVGADEGAFAYVPGSHREDAGPYPSVYQLGDMPGHRVFYGKAGTALLFNSYGMHTSMRNRGLTPRRSIILVYEKFTEAQFNPERFAHLVTSLTTPDRRRLFGLER
jgi:hypothetical protein